MAEPLTIGAAVLGLVGTTVALATRLWPSTPAEPRATVVPPAPAPAAPTGCAVHTEQLAALRRDVDDLRDAVPRIEHALIRIEAAREARAQARREARGERGASDSE